MKTWPKLIALSLSALLALPVVAQDDNGISDLIKDAQREGWKVIVNNNDMLEMADAKDVQGMESPKKMRVMRTVSLLKKPIVTPKGEGRVYIKLAAYNCTDRVAVIGDAVLLNVDEEVVAKVDKPIVIKLSDAKPTSPILQDWKFACSLPKDQVKELQPRKHGDGGDDEPTLPPGASWV